MSESDRWKEVSLGKEEPGVLISDNVMKHKQIRGLRVTTTRRENEIAKKEYRSSDVGNIMRVFTVDRCPSPVWTRQDKENSKAS